MNEELLKQYNAACDAVNAAVTELRAVPDGDAEALATAEAKFNEATAEAERCEGNLNLGESADKAIKRFTPKPVEGNPNELGMDNKEARAYSMVRGIRALMLGDWKGAELEREASEAVAKRMGKDPEGFFVPMDAQRVQLRTVMSVADATYAGDLVATELLSESFISLLRKRAALTKAGATMLGGLQGNIKIPRQTGATTSYWVGENTDITSSSYPTVDQVSLTPHVHGAYTDIGRTLILQSSIDVEQFVRNDLAIVIALGRDLAGLSGTNANDQPCGIASTGSIGSVVGGTNGAAPTWANIVALETAIATANADVDNMAYIVNAATRGYCKTTPKIGTTYPIMLWENSDTPLNGYRAVVSNQVRSNITKNSGTSLSEIFFGNWADLIIASWGTLDIMVNPYVGQLQGSVRISVLEDIDIAVRHPESFARMGDAIV